MLIEAYYARLTEVLEAVKTTQKEKILQAAQMAAKVIENDGIIYIFGCGHSHLLALDCFYRAGGLANVCPVLDADLMLQDGAAKSSRMERMRGIAEHVLQRYCITEKDLMFVVSTSGKNAVPCEMAAAAAKKGIPTVAVVSGAYFDDPTGSSKVYELCDMYIDNCVPHGDAVIDITGNAAKMGSVSTAAGSFILQAVLLEAAELAAQKGCCVPIYKSGNIEGGAQYNEALIEAYIPRIKHL